MNYHEIRPGARLMPFVKCYYIYQSDVSASFEDTVLPSGCMEIIFNLGSGQWQTSMGGAFVETPQVELWGQIIRPLAVRSIGKNTMLGVRFYPHAAAGFLREEIAVFNNRVMDLGEVSGMEVRDLHGRLLDCGNWATRIELVEQYLLGRLGKAEDRLGHGKVVSDVMRELRKKDFFDNIENVASRYGITSRYLQKLFLQHTGLTPKLYSKINRFQHSLRLMGKRSASLTSIAYDCGYFDQSHFIREFKSFTGTTPSGYSFERSPVTFASMNG